MKKALIKTHNVIAGILKEESRNHYIFQYDQAYEGAPISLTMPVRDTSYVFDSFPPFFDGLLPEGVQLEGLLKKYKIDRKDYFEQLLVTGQDLVGAVTVEKINSADE
ncbi:MAG: HipA N-terminal domain-containing protein [Bacteroidales bacterium]|nr:HipA N-terminal domain-containing protein [Bacteroidales bacterium]